MGETNLEKATVAHDIIRGVFAFFDKPAYLLLGLVYQLFFNVASADLFSNATIMKFYGRVQVILGVFMMFQLAMTILRGIIEPDNFTKDKGAGSLIRRVVISLLLITTLMPINISSPRNEYERQVNNNGLLFGTLYSLQHRLLANNTLGRLVLGDSSSDATYMSTNSNSNSLQTASKIFTATILKGFYRFNLVPESERVPTTSGDPATAKENRICPNLNSSIVQKYSRIDADPLEIIDMVNESCTYEGEKKYAFNYFGFIPMVVALVFVFILLSFSVDIAVRAVKLAVLRLLAPIPLISYMNPTGKGDEAFKSWTKALTSTYLDLFIRLAVVYFVIFLIQDMIKHGIVINTGSGLLGVFSVILIWIGLFIFAKQAPKFIKEVLGLKGDTGKLFGGFGELAAAGTVGLGALGGVVSGAASKYTNTSGNQGKKILAGIGGAITGGVGGTVNAGKGYFGSDKPDAKANMARVREYNARNYSNASDDSTFGGRMKAGFQGSVGLQNDLEKMDKKIANYQRAEGAWKSVQNALDSDGWVGNNVTSHRARGGFYLQRDFVASGDTILDRSSNNGCFSIKDLKDAQARMKASGKYSAADLKQMEDYIKSAEKSRFDYIRRSGGNNLETPRERQIYEGVSQIMDTANGYSGDEDGVFSAFAGHTDLSDTYYDGHMSDYFKGSSFAAGAEAGQIKSSSRYAQASANAKRAAEKKK